MAVLRCVSKSICACSAVQHRSYSRSKENCYVFVNREKGTMLSSVFFFLNLGIVDCGESLFEGTHRESVTKKSKIRIQSTILNVHYLHAIQFQDARSIF
jgi:hypothetical protein